MHTDIKSEGYVGVTTNYKNRMKSHFSKAAVPKLLESIRNFDDIEHHIVFEGGEKECYILENTYRPDYNIGWNSIPGGTHPPKISTRPDFEKIKKRISDTLKSKGANPFCENTHSADAIAKRELKKKNNIQRWYHNPESGEYRMLKLGLGEQIPSGWCPGRVSKKKTKIRGVDYVCHSASWLIVSPSGTEYNVQNLKKWCYENSINYGTVFGQARGWKATKI